MKKTESSGALSIGEKEVTIRLEAPYRKDIPKFFLEMCTEWLIPGKVLHIAKFLITRSENQLSCEAVIEPESEGEKEMIVENFAYLEEEIKLGLRSPYHAKKILELKGLSLEEKESFVQEAIRRRVMRFAVYDYDIFPLMQKFLVSVSEEYKNSRSFQALARIVACGYTIVQKVLEGVEESGERRHFFLKVLPMESATPFGEKRVIGFFVGMNFLKETELLEDKHIIRAVQKYCPDAREVEGSSFVLEDEKSLMIYLEMEKDESFTTEEIRLLKGELKEQVQGSIESLVRPVFMPRNEEEIMKYIVTLSKQVTMAKDLPQIVILFQEQSDDDLLFTLLLVRPIGPKTAPIDKLLETKQLEVQIEKVRQAGYIRKTIYKEAVQMRIVLKKGNFLRGDFVVDLYKARQTIVHWLEGALGHVRDYNGGMISRQMEIFLTLQESMLDVDEHSLSNFFHALYPIELRAAVPILGLQEFYTFMEGAVEGGVAEGKMGVYFATQKSFKNFPWPVLCLDWKPLKGFAFFSDLTEERKLFKMRVGLS